MAHVIATMEATLRDDPWHKYYQSPAWLKALIDKGALGQKTGPASFRRSARQAGAGCGDLVMPFFLQVRSILSRNSRAEEPAEKFAKLRASGPQARNSCGPFSRSFHYCAYHLAAIADNARRRFAIRWGFGWQMGRSRSGRPRLEGSAGLPRHRRASRLPACRCRNG
jgi:3-hydroxyacyl-CoA dehydrogenase